MAHATFNFGVTSNARTKAIRKSTIITRPPHPLVLSRKGRHLEQTMWFTNKTLLYIYVHIHKDQLKYDYNDSFPLVRQVVYFYRKDMPDEFFERAVTSAVLSHARNEGLRSAKKACRMASSADILCAGLRTRSFQESKTGSRYQKERLITLLCRRYVTIIAIVTNDLCHDWCHATTRSRQGCVDVQKALFLEHRIKRNKERVYITKKPTAYYYCRPFS